MGIKDLNKVLRSQCKNSIKIISLAELHEKRVAIDISIYLYKFESDNTLIENIFLMISIFYYYKIIPVFIFDGKPPPEKKELLIKRLNEKKMAEKEYNVLKEKIETDVINKENEKDILITMDKLKKKFISIKKDQIEKVKQLILSYGATYLEAPSEADELCAMLVLKKKVWACLSEDTDLFVYGCTRVLRYLSLLNHTAVLYDMENILLELGLTQQQFREICILSGTDYNHSNVHCLEKLFLLHKEYLHLNSNKNISFYEWIEIGCEEYKKINNIFDLSVNNTQLSTFVKENDFQNSAINNKKMREILKEDGFLFC